MRRAAIASVAMHASLVGIAWWMMQAPVATPEEAGGTPVMVQILNIEHPTTATTDAVVSDATQSLVAAGAEPAEPVEVLPIDEAEAVEPLQPARMEPVTEPVRAAEAKAIELLPGTPETATEQTPVEIEPLVAQTTELKPESIAVQSLLAVETEVQEPLRTAMLSPVSDEELEVAPVPRPRLVRKEPEPEREEPAEDVPSKKRPRERDTAGNGGAAEADSVASPAASNAGTVDAAGRAAVNKYPGQVQSRLRRALRQPGNARGAQGEVHVRFIIAASGSVSGIVVVKSSGHDALDAAAITTVKRAAPFPPIPAAANRSSWTFTMPLSFRR